MVDNRPTSLIDPCGPSLGQTGAVATDIAGLGVMPIVTLRSAAPTELVLGTLQAGGLLPRHLVDAGDGDALASCVAESVRLARTLR